MNETIDMWGKGLVTGADFDGDTYEPEKDKVRLTGMLERVFLVMKDGQWHTLRELAMKCGGSEASMSARIRDLRKKKFGGFAVERERLRQGLFRYRLDVTGVSACASDTAADLTATRRW